ncbi:MAG TPA: hypothetical protein VK989_01915, partial [Polyangia bacterium]|nr:hypothetical protein [Polyangia bacterium]
DALCAWGHFPVSTLAREDVRLPEDRFGRLDARVAANALLAARVGTAEECVLRLAAAGHAAGEGTPSFARGRGGVRMDALCRVASALLAQS